MEKNPELMFSREFTDRICSGIGFGWGYVDAEYVVLDYIYSDEDIESKYGGSFVVSDLAGSYESSCFAFRWLYKAEGAYGVTIGEDTWMVEVSKSYFEKWEVTDCYQE